MGAINCLLKEIKSSKTAVVGTTRDFPPTAFLVLGPMLVRNTKAIMATFALLKNFHPARQSSRETRIDPVGQATSWVPRVRVGMQGGG